MDLSTMDDMTKSAELLRLTREPPTAGAVANLLQRFQELRKLEEAATDAFLELQPSWVGLTPALVPAGGSAVLTATLPPDRPSAERYWTGELYLAIPKNRARSSLLVRRVVFANATLFDHPAGCPVEFFTLRRPKFTPAPWPRTAQLLVELTSLDAAMDFLVYGSTSTVNPVFQDPLLRPGPR